MRNFLNILWHTLAAILLAGLVAGMCYGALAFGSCAKWQSRYYREKWMIKVGSIAKDNSYGSWKDSDVMIVTPDTLTYPILDSVYLMDTKTDSLIYWWFKKKL